MIAVIGAGGTFAMEGRHPYDWIEYGDSGIVHPIETVLASIGDHGLGVALLPIAFRTIGSTGILPADWLDLAALIARTRGADPGLAGIVVTHGTATLEETAWFLDLTTAAGIAVVVTGAQRPPNTAGSDAQANLRAAIAVAADPRAAALGALVVMDGQILPARDVTKTASFAFDAFISPAGALGHVAADGTVILRRVPPVRSLVPFDTSALRALPRVDIVLSYAGADDVAIRACLAAGAEGLVSAGLLPGRPANAERPALVDAVRAGVVVIQSSRGSRGDVIVQRHNVADGILAGSDLAPHKLRILLMLALAAGLRPPAIQDLILSL